jgi:predicted dehydrogenase
MILKEKPDIVTICPRWCDKRLEMVTAAAEAGAHMIIEKPLAASLDEARRVAAIIGARRVKAAVGHTARAMSVTAAVRRMLEAGELGDLMEIRGRGKEDKRAGGEDLIVLGTHVFDLMRYYAGNPKWVFAHVTERGRELDRSMMRPASEPVGRVGGTDIAAMFLFEGGVHGYFASKVSDVTTGRRFGLTLAGSKGWTHVPLSNVPSLSPYLLRSAAWVPEKGEPWERVDYAPGTLPPTREATNHLTGIDLIEAIETDREPLCSARDGLWTLEMVEAIYSSQVSGKRVDFPVASSGTA